MLVPPPCSAADALVTPSRRTSGGLGASPGGIGGSGASILVSACEAWTVRTVPGHVVGAVGSELALRSALDLEPGQRNGCVEARVAPTGIVGDTTLNTDIEIIR